MTYQHPMCPPARADVAPSRKCTGPEHFSSPIGAPADRAKIGRRGFLGALAAILPLTAAATLPAAPSPAATPPAQENRRLVRLGEQLAAIEAEFAAAVARRDDARRLALASWPEPPAAMVWDRQRDVPSWCGTQHERGIDDETVYHFGTLRGARHVADAWRLETFVKLADGRTRDAKAARRMLALARDYESAREAVLAGSGYAAARDAVRAAERRLERLAELIHKNQHRTPAGLAIKARAVLAITTTPGVDHQTAFRHKLMHGQTLAQGIVGLQAGPLPSARRAAAI